MKNDMNKKSSKLNIIWRQKDTSLDDVVFVKNSLTDKNLLIKSLAARIVGHFKIEKLLPKLIDSLSTGGEKMSFPDAVATFGKKVVPMLKEKMTQETSVTFRKNVAFVLGRIETKESKNMLMMLARDKSPKVRRVAVMQISHIFDKGKGGIFLGQLLREEKNETVRFFINRAIESVQDRTKIMNKHFLILTLSLCLCATILVASPVSAVNQSVKPQATKLLAWNGWNKTVSWFKNIITSKKTTVTQSAPSAPAPAKPQVSQPTIVNQPPKIQIENKANNKNTQTSPVLKTQPKNSAPAVVVPVVATPPAVKNTPVVKLSPIVATPIGIISDTTKEVEHDVVKPKVEKLFKIIISNGAITTGVETQTLQTLDPKSVTPLDIGGFRDNVYTQPFAINDADEIVGSSLSDANEPFAFYWKDGKMTKLQNLGGLGGSTALAVNDKSQIVGYSGMPFDPRDYVPGLDQGGRPHAVLWENGKIKDLGTFANSSDLYSSTAYDINNSGQIVGELDDHAVLWDNGAVNNLGTLGGDNSRALSINDSGKIVGYADAKNGRQHAVLWDNGVARDLSKGTPFENLESRALSINNKNQIIGVGSVKVGDTYWISKSFFWENGKMKIIDDGGRFRGLNDSGQILSDWGLIDHWSLKPFKYGDDLATGWAGFFLMNFNNKGGVIAGKDEQDKDRNYPKHGLFFQF